MSKPRINPLVQNYDEKYPKEDGLRVSEELNMVYNAINEIPDAKLMNNNQLTPVIAQKIGVSEYKVLRYLRKIGRMMLEKSFDRLYEVKMEHVKQYQEIYLEARNNRDRANAIKALQAVEKLLGLTADVNHILIQNQINQTKDVEPSIDYSNWSVEDLELLTNLHKKYEQNKDNT